MHLLQLSAGQGPDECTRAVWLAARRLEAEARERGLTLAALGSVPGNVPQSLKSLLLGPCRGRAPKPFVKRGKGRCCGITEAGFAPAIDAKTGTSRGSFLWRKRRCLTMPLPSRPPRRVALAASMLIKPSRPSRLPIAKAVSVFGWPVNAASMPINGWRGRLSPLSWRPWRRPSKAPRSRLAGSSTKPLSAATPGAASLAPTLWRVKKPGIGLMLIS